MAVSALIMLLAIVLLGLGVGVTLLRAVWLLMDRSIGPGARAPQDNAMLAQVREELEAMSGRLSRMEEEMDFFKELHAPEAQRRLGGGDDDDGDATG